MFSSFSDNMCLCPALVKLIVVWLEKNWRILRIKRSPSVQDGSNIAWLLGPKSIKNIAFCWILELSRLVHWCFLGVDVLSTGCTHLYSTFCLMFINKMPFVSF